MISVIIKRYVLILLICFKNDITHNVENIFIGYKLDCHICLVNLHRLQITIKFQKNVCKLVGLTIFELAISSEDLVPTLFKLNAISSEDLGSYWCD